MPRTRFQDRGHLVQLRRCGDDSTLKAQAQKQAEQAVADKVKQEATDAVGGLLKKKN